MMTSSQKEVNKIYSFLCAKISLNQLFPRLESITIFFSAKPGYGSDEMHFHLHLHFVSCFFALN